MFSNAKSAINLQNIILVVFLSIRFWMCMESLEHLHYKEPGAQSTYRSYTDWICVGNLHTVVKIWGLCVKLARGRFKMRSLVKLWFHFSHLWKQCWPSAPFVVWASFTTNLPGSDSNGWEGTDVWHSRSLMGH